VSGISDGLELAEESSLASSLFSGVSFVSAVGVDVVNGCVVAAKDGSLFDLESGVSGNVSFSGLELAGAVAPGPALTAINFGGGLVSSSSDALGVSSGSHVLDSARAEALSGYVLSTSTISRGGIQAASSSSGRGSISVVRSLVMFRVVASEVVSGRHWGNMAVGRFPVFACCL